MFRLLVRALPVFSGCVMLWPCSSALAMGSSIIDRTRVLRCASVSVFSVTFHIFAHKYSFWFSLFGAWEWNLGSCPCGKHVPCHWTVPSTPKYSFWKYTLNSDSQHTGSPSTSFSFYTYYWRLGALLHRVNTTNSKLWFNWSGRRGNGTV